MFEDLIFTKVSGKDASRKLQLLTLSTCGFCKRASFFLQEFGFEFETIHLDQIDPEIKKKTKEDFLKAFQKQLSYPALVIDGKEVLIGFIQKIWESSLQVPPELPAED